MATLPAETESTKDEPASFGGQAAAAAARASRRRRATGRTPSEMLARKQQLMSPTSANSSLTLVSSTTALDDRNLPYYLSENSQRSNDSKLAAEQKLESLSALVREKQEEQQDEEQDPKLNNVYILLAKKEKDLQLAAELGKVLLERNDELSKANEKITEEYSHKLELLEQEKHKLKRKLDQLNGEYENRLIELQTDCNILKNRLDQKEQSARQAEKEKAKLIDDLVQQNSRLTRELAEATKSEELLSRQLEQVNERMNARLSNRLDHVAQVDALQDEIKILNQRKQDLERRLKLAQSDKMNLSATIDESGDKILLLENLLNERDSKLAELIIEVNELRDSSSWLAAKLESMISLNERVVGSSSRLIESNLNEEDMKELSEQERSQLIEQLKELRLRTSSRIKASNELLLMNQTQHQHNHRRSLQPTKRVRRIRPKKTNTLGSLGSSVEEVDGDDDDDDSSSGHFENDTMRSTESSSDLINEIYHLLNKFQTNLELRREQFKQSQQRGDSTMIRNSANVDDSGILGDDDSGSDEHQTRVAKKVPEDAGEWRRLLNNIRSLLEDMPCSNCQIMIAERADYEKLQKTYTKLNEEFKTSQEKLLALEARRVEQSTELAQLKEQCQILSDDLVNCDTKSKEQIVQLAWQARDEAVARKNATEIALAKTRIENMQISSQLMEVVQQKGELSQKLAQFEDDIHYMTQRSVQNKFTWEELRATSDGRSMADENGTLGTSASFVTNATTQVLSNIWSKLQNAQIKS